MMGAPAMALAQASIVGVVRDASGAALSGVAVEARSPVLIERRRSAVTDEAGQYAIAGLPPGMYEVRFSLAGFGSVTRPGVELAGSFAATLNVTLHVSAGAETITVTAPSPIVDVRNTAQGTSMTAAIISSIPTGRSLVNLGLLIPGMTAVSARSQTDVGGTNNLQNMFMAIHGGRVADQRTYVDGVTIRNLQSEGHATNFIPDMGGSAEVTIDYSGVDAEEAVGGVRSRFVPRSGGNTFHVFASASGANGTLQGSNLTAAERASGLAPDTLKRAYDVNPAGGGPIVRDRLWFFAAARAQVNENYIGGIFENRNAGNAAAWTYDPDRARPALFSIHHGGGNGRLTWQPARRHTLTLFADKQARSWDEGNVNRAPEAFSRFRFRENQLAILGWTAQLGSRILLEARAGYHAEAWTNIGGDELMANNRALIPVLEQGGAFPNLMYRAKNGTYTGNTAPVMKVAHVAAASVTGAHTIKAGLDVFGGANGFSSTFNDSGLQYRFNNGSPNQLTEFATPYDQVWRLVDAGLFVQDTWTHGRLTAMGGLRLDTFDTSFPQQHLGPGPLTPSRDATLVAADFYRLRDVSPRFGLAFDPTGDGRMALRASAGRYLVALSPATGNPVANLPLSATRAWTDANTNFVPDCNLLDPQANGECGRLSDQNFGGTTPSLRYDPAVVRGWNVRPDDWEFSAGMQRELRTGIAVEAAYFRRVYGHFTIQDNLATVASDYAPFAIPAPYDPRLPQGGGYRVGGLYDLNPGKVGQVDAYVTAADNYGRQIEHWNGADLALSVRRAGLTIQGGVSTGRTTTDICDVAARVPEMLGTTPAFVGARAFGSSIDQCHVDTNWLTQAKAFGSYVVPRTSIQVAATFQSTPGPERQANYVAPSALAQQSLGRPLSGGANTIVTLIAPGTEYGDRLNQLDVRVARPFRAGEFSTTVVFDVYNALNASPVTTANLAYAGSGAAWLQPQSVLAPRLLRVGLQVGF